VLLLKISERATPYAVAPPKALATYEAARKYLEEHCLELASLDDAARGCGLASAYLCRLFQRFDHQSPYRFLLRLKMHHATRLLLDEGLSVKAAAVALDFPDPYNFSRAFKSVYGISPQTFVQQGRRP
jgi:AraC-like DNA-binding protein